MPPLLPLACIIATSNSQQCLSLLFLLQKRLPPPVCRILYRRGRPKDSLFPRLLMSVLLAALISTEILLVRVPFPPRLLLIPSISLIINPKHYFPLNLAASLIALCSLLSPAYLYDVLLRLILPIPSITYPELPQSGFLRRRSSPAKTFCLLPNSVVID